MMISQKHFEYQNLHDDTNVPPHMNILNNGRSKRN